MTSYMQAKQLAVVAACIWATTLAASPAMAQQPDSATINGTIRSPVYGDHTWTLTLQGLSYSYHYPGDRYYLGSMTRVYAASFDFQFQGPYADELNTNVSEPLINSGLQDGPFIQLINFTYFDEDWDLFFQATDWVIAIVPIDYQQGLYFISRPNLGIDWPIFATGANGYPVLEPFTSVDAHTSVYDNRPDSGYSLDIWPNGTVSVSSVGFSLPGDYNHDAAVDAADYVVWRKSPSNFGGNPGGYNTWRANFGRTSGSGLAASENPIPEPGSLALLTLAVPTLLCRRRHRLEDINDEACLPSAAARNSLVEA